MTISRRNICCDSINVHHFHLPKSVYKIFSKPAKGLNSQRAAQSTKANHQGDIVPRRNNTRQSIILRVTLVLNTILAMYFTLSSARGARENSRMALLSAPRGAPSVYLIQMFAATLKPASMGWAPNEACIAEKRSKPISSQPSIKYVVKRVRRARRVTLIST